jgi:hypothetical protein
MWIMNGAEKRLGIKATKQEGGDTLDCELINSLGHLVGVKRGSEYDIESVCVQTGVTRMNVCGLVDIVDFIEFEKIIGEDGVERDVDEFYLG